MKAFLLLTLTFAVSALYGQPSLPPPPAELGERLATLTSTFRATNTIAPGVVIKIYQPGQWEWKYANGIRNVATNSPATPDLVFRAASISKIICATAILKLASERRLSLNDTIGRWLPRTIVAPIERSSQITIRKLLNHTSSLDEPQNGTSLANNFLNAPDINYRDSLFQLIGSQQGLSAELDNFNYSNANFNLQAEIVRNVSGLPYGEYIRQTIFIPLGMNDSYVDTLPATNGFNGYVPCTSLFNCTLPPATLIDYSQANVGWGYGAADISSTTSDLIKFYFALENGSIIPRTWVDSMKANAVDASRNFADKRYGYGTMLFQKDGRIIATGHTGTAASHASLLCRLTESNTYICFSFNIIRMNRERFLDELVNVLGGGSAPTPPPGPIPTPDPNAVTDVYRIYPNPAQQKVSITIGKDETVEAQVFSLTGQLIKRVLLTQQLTELSLMGVAAGVYFIRLINRSGRVQTRRIIVTQ